MDPKREEPKSNISSYKLLDFAVFVHKDVLSLGGDKSDLAAFLTDFPSDLLLLCKFKCVFYCHVRTEDNRAPTAFIDQIFKFKEGEQADTTENIVPLIRKENKR